MDALINGLHHITALTSDAQKNLDFYAGILGLRLVKKTINFDAPEVYHLYYGNETGSPGTIMTFFPYIGMPKGRKGNGQLTVTAFSLSEGSLDYWMKRLTRFKIPFKAPQSRFDSEKFIYLEDFDGLGLELVAGQGDTRLGYDSGLVPSQHAIKGFYGITLSEEESLKTARLLTQQMDYQLIAENEGRFRYSLGEKPGNYIDILCQPDILIGRSGAGTIHHVAFATSNQTTQIAAREKLMQTGINLTPVINREYFYSVYFREPGGVLFEIATNNPGFAVDEDVAHLGETLQLPPWQETHRKAIEQRLPPLTWHPKRFEEI